MRGYCGIGVFHPKHEINIGTLMRSASAFGADYVFTVGRRYKRQASDTVNATRHIPYHHYLTLDDLVGNLPVGCRLVGVELDDRAVPLSGYCHPAQCCYMLGAEDHGLTPEAIDRCHELVVIPNANSCLNVSSAGTVVLYDRSVKGVYQPKRIVGRKLVAPTGVPQAMARAMELLQ